MKIIKFLNIILVILIFISIGNSVNATWTNPTDSLQVKIPGMARFTDPYQCPDDPSKLCFNWIGEYIAAIYKYLIGIVGILAAIVMMYGGVLWIIAGGNQERISNARGYIISAISGLVLTLGSYMVLYYINPNLTKFNPLKITKVEKIDTQTATSANCASRGGTLMEIYQIANDDYSSSPEDPETKCRNQCASQLFLSADLIESSDQKSTYCCICKSTCQPALSGYCSTQYLDCFGDKASQASAICLKESGGSVAIPSSVDKCQPGLETVSWGLFQINISANPIGGLNCPSAFSRVYSASNQACSINNWDLYEQCISAAQDPTKNIQAACQIYSSGGWGRWGANRICQF